MLVKHIRSTCLVAALVLGASACNGNGGTPPDPPGATTGSISGRVTEGSNNVPSAPIGLSGGATRNATTDAGGAYGFADLAPGSYSVTITPPQGFLLRSGDSQTKAAAVTAGQTTTVDWNLDRAGGGPAEAEEIRLTGFVFDRPDITIPAGTTVRWINADAEFHTITPENSAQPGAWQRMTVSNSGDVREHTFSVPGQTYRYRCEPHSADFTQGMVGVIRVQ